MSRRHYVFAGTRRTLTDWEQAEIRMLLKLAQLDDCEQDYDEWHHGGAKGVDAFIDSLGHEWGYRVEVHPALWSVNGKKAGPLRNRDMLDSRNFVKLWAFPSKERSAGTRDCIQAALDRKMDVEVVWLD